MITANPKTAGVARWIFLALWGARLGKGRKEATKYVTKVRRLAGFVAQTCPRVGGAPGPARQSPARTPGPCLPVVL